jgi:hypothetical protein
MSMSLILSLQCHSLYYAKHELDCFESHTWAILFLCCWRLTWTGLTPSLVLFLAVVSITSCSFPSRSDQDAS